LEQNQQNRQKFKVLNLVYFYRFLVFINENSKKLLFENNEQLKLTKDFEFYDVFASLDVSPIRIRRKIIFSGFRFKSWFKVTLIVINQKNIVRGNFKKNLRSVLPIIEINLKFKFFFLMLLTQ
jgi:hypothetical protein